MTAQDKFFLVDTRTIEKPQAKCEHYIHRASGAPIFWINTEDTENVFLVLFHTPPKNSRGITHILEHMVLAGSRKYPIKDPFFSLARKTYPSVLNAFAGDDYTGYFAASILHKDFYRLLDVYLDAIFCPLLRQETFLREGVRLECKEERWNAHGIVFHEMQGSNQKPERALWESLKTQLFPETHYMFNSGGEPLNILDLSLREIVEYHQEYYRPEFATFCFYGNIPIEKHLAYLDEQVFQKCTQDFTKRTPLSKPHSVSTIPHAVCSYPGNPKHAETIFAISWILGKTQDPYHAILGSFLEKILLGHDAALLTRKVLDSGFCNSASGSVVTDIAYTVFFAEFHGVSLSSVQECERYILDQIKAIHATVIPKAALECTIQQISADILEIDAAEYTYGLEVLLKGVLPSFWQANFFDCIDGNKSLELLNMLSNEEIAKRNIQEYLLGNSKRASAFLIPDEGLAKAQKKAIQLLIEDKTSKMIPKHVLEIEKDLSALKVMQECPEDETCVPETPLSELPLHVPSFPWELIKTPDTEEIFLLKANTNGFIYVDLFFPLNEQILTEDLPALSAWTELVTKVQSETRTHVQRVQAIETYTSAFHVEIVSLSSPIDQTSSTRSQIFLHLHMGCMSKNLSEAFLCINETINAATFENRKHVQQLLQQISTENAYSFSEDAHEYIQQLASAHHSVAAYVDTYLHGIEYHEAIPLLKKTSITDRIVSKGKEWLALRPSEVLICCEKEDADKVLSLLTPLLKDKKPSNMVTFEKKEQKTPRKCIRWATTIYHTALAIPYNKKLEDIPHFRIWAAILSYEKLLPKIREERGAYGARAKFCMESNTLVLSSYRDPECEKTIDFFLEQIQQFDIERVSEHQFCNAKRSVLRNEDRPIVPSQRGISMWTHKKLGFHEEIRNQQRALILNMKLCEWKDWLSIVVKEWKTRELKSFAIFSSKNSSILGT